MNTSRTLEVTPKRIERFWRRVDKGSANECWLWTAERHTHGYGLYCEWVGRKRTVKFYAHRLSALIAGMDIDGLVVRHTCDNPPCVNPAHLLPGTQADNVRDARERGRMNMTGLALGWARRIRPCGRCEAPTFTGPNGFCDPCRTQARRERLARKQSQSPQRRTLNGRPC